MTDHTDEAAPETGRRPVSIRFWTTEFADVRRAATLLGTCPATFVRDQAVERAREVIDREAEGRERR